jgi:hypothetical protein
VCRVNEEEERVGLYMRGRGGIETIQFLDNDAHFVSIEHLLQANGIRVIDSAKDSEF